MVIRWPVLILGGWLTGVAWTTSLALVDGWHRGWVDRLTDRNEYLHDLPRIGTVGDFLRGFTSHIIDYRPGSWTTHVSSHPPAATLAFLMLDRIGLGGGVWAGVLVVLVGSVAAAARPPEADRWAGRRRKWWMPLASCSARGRTVCPPRGRNLLRRKPARPWAANMTRRVRSGCSPGARRATRLPLARVPDVMIRAGVSCLIV